MWESKPIQYEGEYVLTTDGRKDFGEMPAIQKDGIVLPVGKIRLPVGEYKGEKGDYGERHIERPKRTELEHSDTEDFYEIKSGLIAAKRHFNKKKPLWVKSDSGGKANGGTAGASNPPHAVGASLSTTSDLPADTSLSPNTPEKSRDV